MNTTWLLMAEFETGVIPLDHVAPKYFNMTDEKKYKRLAAQNKLPIPFFRGTKSQKAPWLCHIGDLAKLIDTSREAANEEFKKSNGK